ncbi:MAG: carboxylate--amine ligase [Chloroflexi bacterium]|nr:carboxylate--amine ligase [Chloroflexota bacterium]MCI0575252.1 carboxylate--amine ligase [Chloroflexota bacterium]MCI0645698.1 carboxylate--amine ligase [Chloroflexota bacterium]MCI0731789.1 carboxylate--amine ligase [Chloroflexota bacterium]
MKQQALKPAAIVVGLDCITGLQTARILAGHSIPVIGIAGNPDHFCCRTRVCQRILVADVKTTDFIELLQELGPQLPQKAVLFPCIDMSVLLISRYRRQLEPWYHIILPEPEVVEMLMDKIGFLTYARKTGLPVPATFLLHNRQEAEEAAGRLSYPCIIKPPIKTPRWQAQNLAKAYMAASGEELLALYDRCAPYADILIVQEWIEGTDADLYSCNCYFNANNEPLVAFIARKLRQWPPHTGTSSLGVEVRNDIVRQTSLALFQGIGYRGLGYVEMKRDSRTGNYAIIEPNIGRPTGRSSIAEAGGVALLYTMYCDALGRPLPANRQQMYRGAKWIYWRHDFQSALYYWRRGQLTLGDWWRSWRGRKACAVFSWNDPAPFLADLGQSVALFLGLGKKKSRAHRAPAVQGESRESVGV